jgi:hypothetical protein
VNGTLAPNIAGFTTAFSTRSMPVRTPSRSCDMAGSYVNESNARSCPAMSPTKADDETAEPDAETEPEHDAEVDHDHDDELSAEDERDIERLDIALTTLDDEALRRGLAGITEKHRQDLATQLNLPRATMHLGDALAPLVRRKFHGMSVDRQHAVATALTQRANDTTVELLGDRSDEPSRADLDEVLPAVIEEHGIDLVRLMVAAYAVSDAPVRPAMRELLDTDERFALPDAPAVGDANGDDDDLPSFGLVAREPGKAKPDPARAEVLEKRKANKAERREAAARERKAKAAAQASRREALHAAKRAAK